MANSTQIVAEASSAGDLVSIKELAENLGIAESTAWLVVRRLGLQRYRVPSKGKTTLVSLSEATKAYNAPRPIEAGE